MTFDCPIRNILLATSFTALVAVGACDKAPEPPLASPPVTTPMTLGTQVDDAVITSGVKSALVADELVKSMDLQVETRQGVVQISGYVDSQAQIDQALTVSRSVAGVTDVQNAMSLKGESGTVGTALADTSVTGRVKAALMADPGIRSFDISVLTHQGEVQLTGFVDSQEQIDLAGRLAAAAEGASSLKNELSIKQ
jgi:hyperosmotically inducible periplasmic protein